MCDTVVELGSATKDGATADNSDRQLNEPVLHIRIPSNSTPNCTYIDIN